MREICVRAPEYLGCYTPPYEIESGRDEITFEGGLLKAHVPVPKKPEQKYLYRPSA